MPAYELKAGKRTCRIGDSSAILVVRKQKF